MPPAPANAPAAAPLPLPPPKATLLAQLVDGLDAAALHWLSGYAAGLAVAQPQALRALQAVEDARPRQRATIVYGSHTGNARRCAAQLQHELEAAGLSARLLRADAYPRRELGDERLLYLVFSTHGDGEPSDDARAFVEFLDSRRAPKLPQLAFAVLGLGDSSYPRFCAIGRQLDTRLAALGARRLREAADADLDMDTVAVPWRAQALQDARTHLTEAAGASVTLLRPHVVAADTVVAPPCDRDRPFAAEVLASQRITGRDSGREIRHVELSLQDSGLDYAPGDALGVWPRNPSRLVEAVLDTLGLDGAQAVEYQGQRLALHDWLRERRELTRLSRPFVARLAELAGDDGLKRLLAPDNAEAFAALLTRDQAIDLLQRYRADWSAEALVAALRPLVPRLYSIASSRSAVGDEAHLTVAHVQYQRDGEPRWGAASHRLAQAAEGERLPVFIEHNERFRLPADDNRDIVMIGPGTGVAPFRGFVQERAARGAGGRNWLLFGNPHARSDFLYQLEWQEALRNGTLHRLDLAFSRDQADKVYVQQRLREHGRELHAWLESGAHLYVCGATAMGRDVHATLRAIVADHGGRSEEAAADYLDALQAQGRYARDVY